MTGLHPLVRPGLGLHIFKGLSSLVSANALNHALTGTVCLVILARLIDGAVILIARYSKSRGLHV